MLTMPTRPPACLRLLMRVAAPVRRHEPKTRMHVVRASRDYASVSDNGQILFVMRGATRRTRDA